MDGLGNLGLAALAVTIMQAGGVLSLRDALYGALVLVLACVRWLDITRYAGTTADSRPATMRDLRRYAVILAGVAALGWLVAHVVGRWLGAA